MSPSHEKFSKEESECRLDENSNLRTVRQLLESKDAILEPGLVQTFADYVRYGGDGGEVPFILARGLTGYPQMARLLQNWLVIAGVPEAEVKAIAWEAVKKEVRRRLDARSLDDSTMRCLSSRPKFLDALLVNQQGRELVIDLYDSTAKQNDDYGRSDLLCHCLREMAACGHVCELLQAKTLDLCDDWYLFEAAVMDSAVRAARPNRGRAPSIEALVTDVLRCCGSRIEARCYANRIIETLECATIAWHGVLWRSMRQDRRILAISPLCQLVRSHTKNPHLQRLRDSVLCLTRCPTAASLEATRDAYIATPCVTFLRAPEVTAALFRLAFDPALATSHTITLAADLVSAVATAPSEADGGSAVPAARESLMRATHTATAAVISAAARACLAETLAARATYNGPGMTGDVFLSAACGCAAARHGILIWIAKMLVNPTWLRARLRTFASSLFVILRAMTNSPCARRRVFIAYRRMVDAPRRAAAAAPVHGNLQSQPSHSSETYDHTDVSKAAVFGLVDLTTEWDCSPDVLNFVQLSETISSALLKHFIFRLVKKVQPPYSLAFATAAANLLACQKARHIWSKIDALSPNEISTIRDFSANIALCLQDANSDNVHGAFLAHLGIASGRIAIVMPKSRSQNSDPTNTSTISCPLESGTVSLETFVQAKNDHFVPKNVCEKRHAGKGASPFKRPRLL